MQQKDMEIRVFSILGGERASLFAYEELMKLFEIHDDLLPTGHHG